MDRIHRLGQHRPVQAIKLVVEDSIESRIVQVCAYSPVVSPSVDIPPVAGEKIGYGRCDPFHRRQRMCSSYPASSCLTFEFRPWVVSRPKILVSYSEYVKWFAHLAIAVR
jgi:hypothetical protein